MKKILIPTDFSENAGAALDYALHLVKGQKANIHIVSVVLPEVVASDVHAVVEVSNMKLTDARKAMEAIEMFSKSFFGEGDQTKIVITTHVAVGGIDHNIKEQAKEFDADLIIMGTQGTKHSMVDKLLGTVSAEVLNSAPCPVILVPHSYKFKDIDNVVFATNLNHGDPYELWRATELIKPHVAVVRCVYVESEKHKADEKELEIFAKYMVENSPSIQTIFNVEKGDNIEKVLSEYADTYDAELIIMHRSKKSIWSKIFGVRHTKWISNWINVPLLVINNT
jgi:nucleotide-binding universal stress UspA family protein